MLEWREAAAATKEVPVPFDELEAEVVAAGVKLRAVRTTPRPTTDENNVLLAIVMDGRALLQAKEGVEPRVEVARYQHEMCGSFCSFTSLTGGAGRRTDGRATQFGPSVVRPLLETSHLSFINLMTEHHDKPPTCRRFDCW